MTDEERAKAEWISPMSRAIRDAGLHERGTPTDRLAMAILMLTKEVYDSRVAIIEALKPSEKKADT